MPKNTVLDLINKSAPPIDIVKAIIEEMFCGEYRYINLLLSLETMLNASSSKVRGDVDELFKATIQKLNKNVAVNEANTMVFLGIMCGRGLGCDVNISKTIALYENAIQLGDVHAMNNRAYIYELVQGGSQDYAKAIALYEKSILLGNAIAMYNRANMYHFGHGEPIDYSKAIILYEKAIKLGLATAMNDRACMHMDGQGGPQDCVKAIALYEKAIDLGDVSAMNNRAYMYHLGQGGPQDYVKAIALYEKSVALGNERSNLQTLQLEEHSQDYLKALWPTLNAGATVSQTSLDFMSNNKTIKQTIVKGFKENKFEVKNKLLTLEAMLSNDNHPLALVLQKGSDEYVSLETHCKELADTQKAIASSEISDINGHFPSEMVGHIQHFLFGKSSTKACMELNLLDEDLKLYFNLESLPKKDMAKKTYALFNTPHIICAFMRSLARNDNQPSHLIALWLLKSIHEFGSLDNPNSIKFQRPKVLSLLKHLSHSNDFIQHCEKVFGNLHADALLQLTVNIEKWLDKGGACCDIDTFLTANKSPLENIELNQGSIRMVS